MVPIKLWVLWEQCYQCSTIFWFSSPSWVQRRFISIFLSPLAVSRAYDCHQNWYVPLVGPGPFPIVVWLFMLHTAATVTEKTECSRWFSYMVMRSLSEQRPYRLICCMSEKQTFIVLSYWDFLWFVITALSSLTNADRTCVWFLRFSINST